MTPYRRVGRSRLRQLGQMLQRVIEVCMSNGGNHVLTDLLRHGGPVVGQRDLRVRRSCRLEVVTPNPSTKLEIGVVTALARLPRDGPRRVEYFDPICHFVVLVGVVLVIHRHPQDLPGFGQALAVERCPYPSGAVDRRMVDGSASTSKTTSAGALIVAVTLIGFSVTPIQTVVDAGSHRAKARAAPAGRPPNR